MRPSFRTLDELRQSLAVSLGFGAVSSMVSLQLPILTEFLQQAQAQLWHEVRWRHLLRVHDEGLGHGQRVLDLPDDFAAGRVDRVFVTADFIPAVKKFCKRGGEYIVVVRDISLPVRIRPCARLYELRHGIPRAGAACEGLPLFYEISSRYDSEAAQIEFAPVPQSSREAYPKDPENVTAPACAVRIEYYAACAPFGRDNDRAGVPDDVLLTLAVAMAKAHYRQPDVQLYTDRFDRMLRQIKADNFGAEGEQAAQPRATGDACLNIVRGV